MGNSSLRDWSMKLGRNLNLKTCMTRFTFIIQDIGEDKFFKIRRTFKCIFGEWIEILEDVIEETNLETKEEVQAFKTAWEIGWQPILTQARRAAHNVFKYQIFNFCLDLIKGK